MNTELQSERLILRQMKISDAPTLYNYWSDPHVTEFMNIKTFQDVEQAKEMIRFLNELASKNRAIRYSILLKKTNQIIGTCGYNYFDFENARAEIAYDLGRRFWEKVMPQKLFLPYYMMDLMILI
ncbi:ribosomal-protein-alanine N-acetyltransferase [Alteribacillus bidgolensis]|uniref:Ribosomal-protein-alanine N-acetyltransferase n=1 Tax=Alteribacillus bidgolensis TaxID=930129 RepID=A0A1G8MEJ7_9BACI|nr:ribosomal-protein-alanine N-acetyltransferase [Alteribacillus bidgolensis]